MKKIFVILSFFIVFCLALFYLPRFTRTSSDVFYLNAFDNTSYKNLEKLGQALKKQGINIILSAKNQFQSGLINIYATEDVDKLPPVINQNAINFLWVPRINRNDMESFRPYDVIIVKNMPDFSHLKAINVRTAYIPHAINITSDNFSAINKDYPMYYGDNDGGFSLALYLAGPTDLKIDVYGKGFSGLWTESDLMKETATPQDFQRYPLVLADQSDDDIRDEIINQRIITIIENGGLPYIRYNNGIVKMFGDTIPMYRNETAFLPEIKRLLNNPQEILARRKSLLKTAEQWSATSQAKKFIELADIMKKKMKPLN